VDSVTGKKGRLFLPSTTLAFAACAISFSSGALAAPALSLEELILLASAPPPSAKITALDSFDEFSAATIFTNDFETGVDTPQVNFNSSAFPSQASTSAGGVTTSGKLGLSESSANDPLSAFLLTPAIEVGMFFGNDDFGLKFDVTLTALDLFGNPFGSVSVKSNGNDHVDQFIGLRSDTEFERVELSYSRPGAKSLSLFIDDFTIGVGGTTVDEPGAFGLLLCALLAMIIVRAQRRAIVPPFHS
jgi:hypothetical protein